MDSGGFFQPPLVQSLGEVPVKATQKNEPIAIVYSTQVTNEASGLGDVLI